MDHLSLELSTMTATFAHGARGGKRAELRPQAFEAAARYWFRAAAGIADPGRLAEAEGRLFGSADHGRGLVFDVRPRWLHFEGESYLLPHHPRNGKRRDSPGASAAVPAGTELELRVHAARRSDARSCTERAAASLWLALHLGGVGQRSRRGAGSLRVRSWRGSADFQPARGGTAAELAASLSTGIMRARAVLGAKGTPTEARHPVLAERVQVVELEAQDEEGARKEIMLRLGRFKDPAFGLPYLKPANGGNTVNGRHASPLWIHLTELSDGRWAVVQTWLSGPIPASGDRNRIGEYMDSFSGAVRVEVRR